MARFLLLVASAFIVNTATAGLIPESSNPCQLGGLQVTYRDERYPCGETVSLDVFSNGKPPGDVTLDADVTEDNKYYTLVMVDPDAPASRGQAYWLHWLVINIKGDNFASGYHGSGSGKMDYAPPSPPRGPAHRYQFFVFEQPREFGNSEITAPDRRGSFDLGAFQSEYNLDGPVAGYQILTQNV
ncbi:protein D2-like isoform X1 [Patiria miniata]|uniref:Phosphatidylethanolamine-binding protein n=1 Tax=Patiria miniata TaxID=46514 RepID=A0A914B544_PATMI|nr:protein D2-like isoform X1 [Patiria miniata]